MTYKKSQEIYKQLIIGKYINKSIYDKSIENTKINELYTEIDTYFEEYFDLYEKIGFKLIQGDTYFYLIDKEKDTEDNYINKVAFKEYIMLISIFKYCLDENISLDNFQNPLYGIQWKDLEQMLEKDWFIKEKSMSEIQNQKPIHDILIKPNVIYLNVKNNLVLSDVGIHFYKMIKEEGKELFQSYE